MRVAFKQGREGKERRGQPSARILSLFTRVRPLVGYAFPPLRPLPWALSYLAQCRALYLENAVFDVATVMQLAKACSKVTVIHRYQCILFVR